MQSPAERARVGVTARVLRGPRVLLVPIVYGGDAARARACAVSGRAGDVAPLPDVLYVLRCPACGALLGVTERAEPELLFGFSHGMVVNHPTTPACDVDATVYRVRVLGEVSR